MKILFIVTNMKMKQIPHLNYSHSHDLPPLICSGFVSYCSFCLDWFQVAARITQGCVRYPALLGQIVLPACLLLSKHYSASK